MFQGFGYKIKQPRNGAETARQFVSRKHPPITMHKPAGDNDVVPQRTMQAILKKLQEWKLV